MSQRLASSTANGKQDDTVDNSSSNDAVAQNNTFADQQGNSSDDERNQSSDHDDDSSADDDENDDGDGTDGDNEDGDNGDGTSKPGDEALDRAMHANHISTPAPEHHELVEWIGGNKDRQHLLDCNGISTSTDPATVSTLDCFFATFTSIPNITDMFTNLTTLRILIAPQITSVHGIETCVNLKHLWICECNVEDLSPIGRLTKLQELHIFDNAISSIDPLAPCTHLQVLNAEQNAISSVAVLGDLPLLENINLAHNRISQLPSSLSALSRLHTFNVAGNPIADFAVSLFKPMVVEFPFHGHPILQ